MEMEIEIKNLIKKYGDYFTLNVSYLSIKTGELVGLVGNNGAGKTTLLRLILDLISTTQGIVCSDGKPVNEDFDWKRYTGSFLDESFLISFYTPEEFFSFIAEIYGFSQNCIQELLKPFERLMNGEILGKRKLIKDFSTGNKQKIGIIAAMMIKPKVLILDEPFNFLDPSSQFQVCQLIQLMNKELGTTVLISSHNLTSINEICSRIILIEKGNLIKDLNHIPGDTANEIQEYFGSSPKSN